VTSRTSKTRNTIPTITTIIDTTSMSQPLREA
jgi:hypothetical protein